MKQTVEPCLFYNAPWYSLFSVWINFNLNIIIFAAVSKEISWFSLIWVQSSFMHYIYGLRDKFGGCIQYWLRRTWRVCSCCVIDSRHLDGFDCTCWCDVYYCMFSIQFIMKKFSVKFKLLLFITSHFIAVFSSHFIKF